MGTVGKVDDPHCWKWIEATVGNFWFTTTFLPPRLKPAIRVPSERL